jgi:hypothetical protein
MENNAIFTKDSMIKRNQNERSLPVNVVIKMKQFHLFFECPVAKMVWSVVAHCFGANNIPTDLAQCWVWVKNWLPNRSKVHTSGIALVCWAIWKT